MLTQRPGSGDASTRASLELLDLDDLASDERGIALARLRREHLNPQQGEFYWSTIHSAGFLVVYILVSVYDGIFVTFW